LPWLGALPKETDPTCTALGDPTPLEFDVPPLAELRAAALEHPLLRRAHAQSAAALAHVRAEQRQRWPVISGLVTVNVGDPTLGDTDVLGGASLDLPVLNRRGGAIARARAQESVAQASLELDRRRTLAEVQDAYYSLQAAGGRARALRTQVLPAMTEAAQLTEDSYREGRADLVRLLEAQRAVVEARLAAVEAVSSWSKTIADLERAVGRKLDAR
jgi:cobalt-zinc-cadmium efflux system outer membrane protein